jgi:hypothetical protein
MNDLCLFYEQFFVVITLSAREEHCCISLNLKDVAQFEGHDNKCLCNKRTQIKQTFVVDQVIYVCIKLKYPRGYVIYIATNLNKHLFVAQVIHVRAMVIYMFGLWYYKFQRNN